MQVSREYALRELESIAATLAEWGRELHCPAELTADAVERSVYPDGVPAGLSVDDVEGFPGTQFRAELMAIAGRLEALASF
jgi:hypothetical protein